MRAGAGRDPRWISENFALAADTDGTDGQPISDRSSRRIRRRDYASAREGDESERYGVLEEQ
jgi:hypothetical protein